MAKEQRSGGLRLLLVDDHEVVRTGLSAALGAEPAFEVVGSVATAADALDFVRRLRPAVAVVDYRLPDMTGDALCRQLRLEPDPPAVIVLSTYLSEAIVRSAFDAGAAAYVTKSAGMAELKKEILRIGTGMPTSPTPRGTVSRLARLADDRQGPAGTTPQQLAVLRLAASGLTDRQIGTKLYVSESTVRFHIQNLKRRFGVHNKVELIARAIQEGVLEPTEGAARVVRA